jgi:hypothetical protein
MNFAIGLAPFSFLLILAPGGLGAASSGRNYRLQ